MSVVKNKMYLTLGCTLMLVGDIFACFKKNNTGEKTTSDTEDQSFVYFTNKFCLVEYLKDAYLNNELVAKIASELIINGLINSNSDYNNICINKVPDLSNGKKLTLWLVVKEREQRAVVFTVNPGVKNIDNNKKLVKLTFEIGQFRNGEEARPYKNITIEVFNGTKVVAV